MAREPVFDLPGALVGLVGLLIAVHVLRGLLSADDDIMVLAFFAFIPDRLLLEGGVPAYPGGWGAIVWTFVSHAALHGSWTHLLFNAVMLAAAGKPVVRRLGIGRFLALVAASAAAGAAVHLAVDWASPVPMIGASGVVFGIFGAVLRFGFASPWASTPSALGALNLPRVRGFILALVVMNLILVVAGTAPFGGGAGSVAWAAHLGGFLPGFFAFRLFDPALRR
ncbi:MAG: rhomboid family intramembrane serine protease [Siculibacillus sp.]|nr:rhomboid family intramembrane serine protease [Siculibacillus sp.]